MYRFIYSASIYDRNGQLRKLDKDIMNKLEKMSSQMASQGLRVLALASGPQADNLTFNGFVGITDPPRKGVADSISKLHSARVQVVMITGKFYDIILVKILLINLK